MIRRSLALLAAGAVFAAGAAFATKFTQPTPPFSDAAFHVSALHDESGISLADRAYPEIAPLLEQADALGLSAVQRQQLRALGNRVQGEVQAARREIITLENRLQRGFAEQTIDPLRIDGLTTRIGELEGRLRAAELLGRLDARAILLPAQLARYGQHNSAGTVAEIEPAERPFEEF